MKVVELAVQLVTRGLLLFQGVEHVDHASVQRVAGDLGIGHPGDDFGLQGEAQALVAVDGEHSVSHPVDVAVDANAEAGTDETATTRAAETLELEDHQAASTEGSTYQSGRWALKSTETKRSSGTMLFVRSCSWSFCSAALERPASQISAMWR